VPCYGAQADSLTSVQPDWYYAHTALALSAIEC
jgi:hypothetical protein